MNNTTQIPRCGDVVKHRPSGETWLVAFADPERDELAASGWPNSRDRLSDCEIVRACTDAQHDDAVNEWVRAPIGDSRRPTVLRLYRGTRPNEWVNDTSSDGMDSLVTVTEECGI